MYKTRYEYVILSIMFSRYHNVPKYIVLKPLKEDLEIRNIVDPVNVIETKPNTLVWHVFKTINKKTLLIRILVNHF